MADPIDIAQANSERWIDNVINAHEGLPREVASNCECLECGEPISPARREAVPYAKTCVECQTYIERFGG